MAQISLPHVLARLSAGEDLEFSALRPHQRAAWHAFLVQLAYLALEDDDVPRPPQTAEGWVEKLRALAPEHDDAPWCLVNTDWQQPAFLQAPCSPGREADFKRTADAAQDIDVLVTARHPDEKTGKLPLRTVELDTPVYATVLITRDVEDRYRGFLSSAMLEMAPGVYASPSLSARARDKVWKVVSDWHAQLHNGSIVLIFPDSQADGGLAVRSLGSPPRQPVRLDGVLLTLRVNT